MTGGGSASGKTDYPGYMKDFHHSFLTFYKNHGNYLVDNPDDWTAPWDYSWAAPIPPDGLDGADQFDDAVIEYEDIITALETKFESWLEEIQGMEPTHSVWALMLPTITTAFDTYIGDADSIQDSVDHFEQAIGLPYSRARNRITAGLAEVNAVNSSAFAFGLALLEVERGREVSEYTSKLERQHELNRIQFITNSMNQIIQIESMQQQSWAAYTQLYMGFKKLSHIARQEYVDKRIQYKYDRGHYELDVWSQGGALLGGPGGGGYVPRSSGLGTGTSKAGSALAGAMTGAMIGGAAGGGWGMAAGLVIGGVAGYFLA